ATLAGHALLPAFTLIPPPADAPLDAWVSGKFTGPARNHVPMSVPGDTGGMHGRRKTGHALPFLGQPLQGFSGFAMARHADGSIYALVDNGFGNKRNSPDALLYFTRLAPDWQRGTVEVREVVWLRDPDKKVPFRIVNEEKKITRGIGMGPIGKADPETADAIAERLVARARAHFAEGAILVPIALLADGFPLLRRRFGTAYTLKAMATPLLAFVRPKNYRFNVSAKAA
ncbi:MAG: esterase-like activity of phytase family protein, partial [Thermaurantiacus sp.]